MIRVLSCEEAFSLDKTTIKSGYLSEKKLMDNAGRSLAQFIMEYILDPTIDREKTISVVEIFETSNMTFFDKIYIHEAPL